MTAAAFETEALRQQALLAALAARGTAPAGIGLHEGGARAEHGLGAYRANAAGTAERALGAIFVTVVAMVGAEDFAHLAREFWRAQPPLRGDLGEWGDGFPDWLQAHPSFTAWPYLGDAARLDLALHGCERAADAAFDAASLALRSEAEPQRLHLHLMPGSALVESRWPLAAIHAAHQGAVAGFDAVRELLAQGVAAPVFVSRQGWRGTVHRVDAVTLRWTRCLLAGADLATALADAGEAFDFAAWLARALAEKWLKGASVASDQMATSATAPTGDAT